MFDYKIISNKDWYVIWRMNKGEEIDLYQSYFRDGNTWVKWYKNWITYLRRDDALSCLVVLRIQDKKDEEGRQKEHTPHTPKINEWFKQYFKSNWVKA